MLQLWGVWRHAIR